MKEKKHRGQHKDCFACKIQSIQISAAATPTRNKDKKTEEE
jgi:hypothetical protein